MKDLFLADAHLGMPEDANYQRLLRFLDKQGDELRSLFLLGDMFEFWSNFRTPPAPYRPLVASLEGLAKRGVRVYWVEGNHDFHLRRYFADREGFWILPDGGLVDLGTSKVYVAHGDLVDPHNTSYLRLRRILRSWPLALLTGTLPIPILEKIAARMSHESKKVRRTYDRSEELAPLLEAHARRHLAEGADAVITGHYHTPMQRSWEDGTMIALGDWIHDYSYVEHRDGVFTLLRYSE